MTFADKLRAQRARLGLSQAATATLLGIGSRTLQNWESGNPVPSALKQNGVLALLAQQRTPGNGKKGKA